MAQEPELILETINAVSVIKILGDVSASADGVFDSAYREAADTADHLLLSFRDGDRINSGGIAILIDLIAAGQRENKQILIAHPSAHFREVFELVGLTKYTRVFAIETEAINAF